MLGEQLRTIRKQKGFTQEELAARTNVVRQTVSKWEKGLSVPDAEALQRLAEVLDVSVGQLLGADLEQERDRNELAEQLMKLNEQLAIRNRRARRIWKTVGITLAVLAGTILLLIVLGVGVFSFDRSEGGMKRVEETGTIEEAQLPAEGERGPGEIAWNW